MKCVLLSAGYATRLYPLTENMPKALLKLFVRHNVDIFDVANLVNFIRNHF